MNRQLASAERRDWLRKRRKIRNRSHREITFLPPQPSQRASPTFTVTLETSLSPSSSRNKGRSNASQRLPKTKISNNKTWARTSRPSQKELKKSKITECKWMRTLRRATTT